ncbi:MAG: DUF4399 domain-containing protein [Pseudomonadota bacterium]
MLKTTLAAAALCTALAVTPAVAQERSASPEGAAVYFINLSDGDTVASPLLIQFGLTGMGIAPAGHERDGSGHHHLLVNRPAYGEGPEDEEFLELGIVADDNHLHFGGGQTEVSLELPAGTHTLQLLLGDHDHIPHDPPVVSDMITITVE